MKHYATDKSLAEIQAILWLAGMLFIVLKILGLIDWSWLMITAPIWLQIAFAFSNAFIESFVRARLRRKGKGGEKV